MSVESYWGSRGRFQKPTLRVGPTSMISFFKNASLKSRRSVQFRIELYNAFNNTEFGMVDTAAIFDFATGRQTNPSFGRVTAARDGSARTIQLGIRLVF